MSTIRPTIRPARWPYALLAIAAVTAAAAGAEPLTLRLSDARGAAGDLVAVVVRTYAPRPIGQGQICLRASLRSLDTGSGGPPFAALEDWAVFSAGGDASGTASFDPEAQMLMVDFFSASGSINATDGPLAVAYLRLADGLAPGEIYALSFDMPNTQLIGPEGEPIAVNPEGGELAVRLPGAPYLLGADGDRVAAGGTAQIGVETVELFAVGGARVGLRFDPAAVFGSLQVSMDPRHGAATFTAETPEPGLLVVEVDSPDGSLNQVPGNLIRVAVRTTSQLGGHPLSLDPDLTVLTDPAGAAIPLTLGGDLLEIEPGPLLFGDGFEAGGLASWDGVTP